MIRFLVPVFGLLLTAGLAGCQKDTMATDDAALPASADVCPSCRGTQKATAAGKCESCGTMVSAADACTHCAGTQVATAEGKCPSCGVRVGR